MRSEVFLKVKEQLNDAGWKYIGTCGTCSVKSYKFQKGKYVIRIKSNTARLLFRNQTILNGTTETIQALTDYVDREAAVLA